MHYFEEHFDKYKAFSLFDLIIQQFSSSPGSPLNIPCLGREHFPCENIKIKQAITLERDKQLNGADH